MTSRRSYLMVVAALAAIILTLSAVGKNEGLTKGTVAKEAAAGRSKRQATLPAMPDTPIPRYEPRFGRSRPVIAVLGDNAATETTDYVVPYGILAESHVADVVALGMEAGPIQMKPALRIQPQATTSEFDARYPDGADYVIVPNIYNGAEKPVVLDWVRAQARHGATIVGICDGVPVLANAGLLEGRSATGHWFSIDRLERKHRNTTWVRNTRYVTDGKVITTSGVSASVPISIALVEAIAGREQAAALAQRLGVNEWSAAHDSSSFRAGPLFATALRNKVMIWNHEEVGVAVTAGVDEIPLALTADLWSRTMLSRAVTVTRTSGPLAMRNGLTLLPDREAGPSQPSVMLAPFDRLPAAQALESALDGIEKRHGRRTAAMVATQIEYVRQ